MGIEIGLIFAFLAMLCWGFGDFFIQRSVRKVGNIEALAFIGIIGAIGLFPFVLGDLKLIFSLQNLLLLGFLGILTFVVALLDFEALKEGKISVIDVIIELELPVTIILGFIFFRESLTMMQLGVISLIFVGVVLIASKKHSFDHPFKKLEKGVFIAFLAAIGMGLINFFTATSSKTISPMMAVWVPWVIFTIICLFFIYRREGMSKFVKNGIKFKWLLLAMGIFDTLAWLFYANAVFGNEIAITTAITESYPVVALFLGLWFNQEKIKIHQYVGAGLALISSFALAFLI